MKNGTLQEFQSELNNIDEIEELMRNKTNLHGINHIIRVLFNAYAIITLENVNDEDKKIIIEAAKLHDIGRISDGEDEEHGLQGSMKARNILENKGFSAEEIDKICFIIEEHSLPKSKNNEDIEKLPEEIKQKYRYCLNLLKDADKLDRVRIGDLNPQRLSTESAKRLVQVAEDIFENNRYYYKKKMKVYQFNEKDAKEILEEIKKENPKINIDLEEIKKNYSKYKAIQEQDKIEWIKSKDENISINDFIEIINVLSKEDMEYLRKELCIGPKVILQAINAMGIDKYIQLKTDGKMDEFMNMHNYIKLVGTLTKEETDLLLKFRSNDLGSSVIDNFYIYYHFMKNSDPEKVNMLLLNMQDKVEYINGRIDDKDTGYKWIENKTLVPLVFEILAIKKMDTKSILDIRKKRNIPLNVITTAMLELNLLEGDIERKDLERILLNYHKFNLNIREHCNIEQMTKLLLSIPENIGKEYENIIKECDKNDDINELRKIILETKIKNLNGIKRDIYFYKKYVGIEAENNQIVKLFEILLKSQNKEELLNAYKKLNSISTEFDLDETLSEIRETLSEISKKDVTSKMTKMKTKIENTETKNVDESQVVNLTGTDFNLLISVIAGAGSPYLVNYYNNSINKANMFRNNRKLHKIVQRKTDIDIKLGTKRLIDKRYKIDPLKNRQRCVSSIDQDFLGHIKSSNHLDGHKQIKDKLILAYFPQQEVDISYMGNQDLMTIYNKPRTDATRKRVPHEDNMERVCNLKLQDLNSTTIGDNNELIVDSYPGAVMCFNTISDISKKTAKRLNIPILYINNEKQFEIIKQKVDRYYTDMKEKILEGSQITDETFEEAFNVFENNIIHAAFKLANGFNFLDSDEYPREQIIEMFDKMTDLVRETLKRCNSEQRQVIQTIMLKEADVNNLKQGDYDKFIDFEKMIKLVMRENESDIIEK